MADDGGADALRAENEELRLRLEEAEATLDAIRRGEVDALVVAGADGHRVYTLEGADRFYRVLIEAMQPGQGAASLAADGAVLYCNRSFADLLGVAPERVGGRAFHEFVCPADREAWDDILKSGQAAPAHGELALQPAGGPPVPVHLALNALPLAGAVALGLVVTDLSERRRQEETARKLAHEEAARATAEQVARQARRAEAAVRESEARFRTLADALPQIVWMTGPDGLTDYYNRRWFEFTGMPAGGRGTGSWTPVVHPADLPATLERWTESVQTGRVFQNEYRLRDGRTGAYRWFLGRAVPVRDGAGRVVRWFGTCTDIDDTKRAGERQRLLGEAAAVLLTTEDPDEMMRELFARIAPHLALDTYFNFLVDEAAGDLRLVSCVGVSEEAARAIGRLPFGQAICGTVARERRPRVGTFLQQSDDPRAQLARSFGLRVYACNPLLAGERLLGTLSFASRSRDRFDDDELEFLRTVSQYVTVAYERLRLVRQLRETDRKKDEFLATLAHELRNPLAPVRNAVQFLQLAGPAAPAERNARDIIERQVRHLTRLVDDLLDVSRITRGKVVLQRERVELGAVIAGAVEAARPAIDAAGHGLTVALPPEPVYLEGDPTRLVQVFGNLLVNAAKYTDPGGRIRLAAEAAGGDVVVTVTDTGIGIPADHLAGLFELFSQVDAALDRTQGGLGIGLALVKGLVELHGGSVAAASAGRGRGSEFTVRLPRLVGAAASAGPGPAAPAGPVAGSRCRVLVADDNVDSADSLALLLSVLGHEVAAAHDGQAAVDLAGRFQPDVALLDIGMPRLNGYEAARRIRAGAAGRPVVLVALTGWGQDEDKRRAEAAGFDHHFTKPVDPARLQAVLEASCRPPAADPDPLPN